MPRDHVWANAEAGRLRTTRAELIERLGRDRLAADDAHGALEAAEQGLHRDSLNEALWRLAMQAETALGLREAVGRRYEALLEGDRVRTRVAGLLLLRESWPFGSGQGGPDYEWSREIHSRVRAARSAQHAADILAARDAVEFPSNVIDNPAGSGKRYWSRWAASIGRAWRLIGHHPRAPTRTCA